MRKLVVLLSVLVFYFVGAGNIRAQEACKVEPPQDTKYCLKAVETSGYRVQVCEPGKNPAGTLSVACRKKKNGWVLGVAIYKRSPLQEASASDYQRAARAVELWKRKHCCCPLPASAALNSTGGWERFDF